MDATEILASCTHFKNKRMLLGVTGSIACYKSIELTRLLSNMGIGVSATISAGAQQFVNPMIFASLGAAPIYPEMYTYDVPFGHLEPGRTCQAFFVAPASAGILARMANGLATDMLAGQFLAFEGPVGVAPAMNTKMWNNLSTRGNVETLLSRGVTVVSPSAGQLACGEDGTGRLAPLPVLHAHALRLLAPKDMVNETVLITMGPTRETWDYVRFWSNPSSGIMGASLALSAWLRGARVHCIVGPGVDKALLPAVPGLAVHHVDTAVEMRDRAAEVWPDMTMGMFTAAVADYRPVPYGKKKFKKAEAPDGFEIRFVPNPDIMMELASNAAPHQKILGFAAETAQDKAELIELAKAKMKRKHAHLLAANSVTSLGSGFGSPTNALAVVSHDGREDVWPQQSKMDAAWDLCTWLLSC